jgi:hypothetical protein
LIQSRQHDNLVVQESEGRLPGITFRKIDNDLMAGLLKPAVKSRRFVEDEKYAILPRPPMCNRGASKPRGGRSRPLLRH